MKTPSHVYVFGTCLIDMYYPRAGLDAVALLELCGMEVSYPQAQTCCGQAAYNAGFSDYAAEVAAHTVSLFHEENWPIVVPSASCAGMIKHHYPRLLANNPQWKDAAERVAERCVELIDFIAERLPYERLPAEAGTSSRVALHTSCAAQREMAVAPRWIDVLARLPGIDVCQPANAQECCGFGGTFAVKSPDLSQVMTEDKCQALLDLEPDCIASGDCGCLMNIGTHLAYEHGADPCIHLASLIAKAFGVHHEH